MLTKELFELISQLRSTNEEEMASIVWGNSSFNQGKYISLKKAFYEKLLAFIEERKIKNVVISIGCGDQPSQCLPAFSKELESCLVLGIDPSIGERNSSELITVIGNNYHLKLPIHVCREQQDDLLADWMSSLIERQIKVYFLDSRGAITIPDYQPFFSRHLDQYGKLLFAIETYFHHSPVAILNKNFFKLSREGQTAATYNFYGPSINIYPHGVTFNHISDIKISHIHKDSIFEQNVTEDNEDFDEFKNQIGILLIKYIRRVSSYPDYNNFFFYSESRSINRKLNALLAQDLLDKWHTSKDPIECMAFFSDDALYASRTKIKEDNSIRNVERRGFPFNQNGINSKELNEIIDLVQTKSQHSSRCDLT